MEVVLADEDVFLARAGKGREGALDKARHWKRHADHEGIHGSHGGRPANSPAVVPVR